MRIVRESLDFERGKEPIKAMGIGQDEIDRKIIKETDWLFDLSDPDFYSDWDLIRNYRGIPILIAKFINDEEYIAVTPNNPGIGSGWQKTKHQPQECFRSAEKKN